MGVTKNNKVFSEQLVAHFDLNADPFNGGEGVFFEGAQRQHNLETLRHMSTFGDMVLILTGEKGAGKSTLIERFVEVCSNDLNIYVADIVSSNPKEKSQSVIHRLCQSVGLSSIVGETTRQSFSRLLEHLEDQFKKNGLRNVLVFDDADSLPKKEIQFYFSYFSQLPKESGVVAIFTGAPSLLQVARLSNVEGNEEWLHQVQLRPLVAADILEYLQQRLEHVGFKGLLELSENQVQHLIDMGKGLPGRINRLFSSVVLEPGSLKLPKKTNAKVPPAVFAGVFLLLGLSFVFVSYQHGLFGSAEESAQADEVSKEEASISEVADDLFLEQRAARLKMLDQALLEANVDVKSEAEVLSNDQKPSAKVKEEKLDKIELTVSRLRAEARSEEVAVVKDERADSSPAIGKTEEGETKQIELKARVISENKVEEAPVEIISKPFFKNRSWVESQNGKAYSAQILGSYNEQTAIEFAQRVSKEVSSIYYLETLHRKRKWYVVFYGVFPDKSSAQAAIKKAPKVITVQQPWLRRFDGILASYPK